MRTVSALVLASVLLWAKDPKPTTEELLAHHLQAIGPQAARAAVVSRVVEGQLLLVTKDGKKFAGVDSGSHLISQSSKLRIHVRMPAADYQGDDAVYDGEKAHARPIGPADSMLSRFLSSCDGALKSGFLGGVLTTGWRLQKDEPSKSRLKVLANVEIDGAKLWRTSYEAPDATVYLYFDQNFRHVATNYGALGCMGLRSRFRETFDSFIDVGGLTLPSRWTLSYQRFSNNGQAVTEIEWVIMVQRIEQNGEIAPDVFTLDGPLPLLKKPELLVRPGTAK